MKERQQPRPCPMWSHDCADHPGAITYRFVSPCPDCGKDRKDKRKREPREEAKDGQEGS